MRAFFVFLLVLAGALSARADNINRSATGKDVTISIESPFTQVPPGGCVPYQVLIKNDRHAPGTWHIVFQGSGNYSRTGAVVYGRDLSVPPNTSATFNLAVPVPTISERSTSQLSVGVGGPGFEGSEYKENFAYFFTNNTGPQTRYTVVGRNVVGTIGLGPLESYYKDKGKAFYGSVVDSLSLPIDWRSYAGVASFILKDSEWTSLTAPQREAVSDYVAQGGHLTVLTTENLETLTPQLQLPSYQGKAGGYGFGTITLQNVAAFPPDALALNAIIENRPAASAENVDQGFYTWTMHSLVGTIAISAAFILTFVILFGILVGPVNLFAIARGKNRFRLFWTTPLISLLASLALIVGILITDGLGGTGKQFVAIYSLPASNREVVVQEQIARTAVLFSTHWHNDQNYLLTPISNRAVNNAIDTSDYRTARPGTDLAQSPDTYRQDGNDFSGNWFRSRSISGQYLQTVRSSRAALTVLNPAAPETSQEPPVVLSSYSQELTHVYLCDAMGKFWECDHLAPGRKTTCVPATNHDFNTFWDDACTYTGGKLKPLLRFTRGDPGCFYATGPVAPGENLTTLGEIRWQVVQGIYLGPWVASPTPEAKR